MKLPGDGLLHLSMPQHRQSSRKSRRSELKALKTSWKHLPDEHRVKETLGLKSSKNKKIKRQAGAEYETTLGKVELQNLKRGTSRAVKMLIGSWLQNIDRRVAE